MGGDSPKDVADIFMFWLVKSDEMGLKLTFIFISNRFQYYVDVQCSYFIIVQSYNDTLLMIIIPNVGIGMINQYQYYCLESDMIMI